MSETHSQRPHKSVSSRDVASDKSCGAAVIAVLPGSEQPVQPKFIGRRHRRLGINTQAEWRRTVTATFRLLMSASAGVR